MTTIVNTPASTNEGGGSGLLIGLLLIIGLGILFLYIGLPALRNMGSGGVNVPTQIVMPETVDVNVTQPK